MATTEDRRERSRRPHRHRRGRGYAALERALRARVDGEVRFDAGSRGAYATDGSNYRQPPIGVVVPRTVEAGAEAVAVCAEYDAPVLSRGGGTSLGGQCTNTAVVIDWTKYCNRLVSVDAERRRCVVEPGLVLDELNRQLAGHGLRFGPKPATHSHCTLGGMIGNNSCGASAQAYGKTGENVRRLEVLTYDGLRTWVGPTSEEEYRRIIAEGGRKADLYRRLHELADRYLADIRLGYPDIPRRVSGYNLDALLPENGFDLARALVGSEGTLVTVLRAEIDLVPVPAADCMLVLGYPDVYTAADDVPELLRHSEPAQLEALDDRMTQLMREEGVHLDSLDRLPRGRAWLMLQFTGDTAEEADGKARRLLSALGRTEDDPTVTFSDDPGREQQLLMAREAGLGVTARPPDDRETWEGWEDSAVPPDKLGGYLRDLHALFDEFGYGRSALYGHFGQGCVHTRIPFGLRDAEGVARFRRFLERAADLVAGYGGSLSGEHGDGQARGELLPRMFGPELTYAFGELKAVFDPGNRMNPGKVAAPAGHGSSVHRVDGQLRLGPKWRPWSGRTSFGYPEDKGSFTQAVLRCVGIGNCRSHRGGVMCPSYRATGEEEHSTRGRARLLFEMLDGPGTARTAAPPSPRSPTGGGPPRCATPSTSAWPARAASRTARPGSTWPPTRRSSSPSTTPGGCGRPRTTRWGGCRSGPGWSGRPRGSPTPCCAPPAWPGWGSCWRGWTPSAPRRRSPPSPSPSGGPGGSARAPSSRRPGPATRTRCCCGRTPSARTSTPGWPRRRCGCWRTPATGWPYRRGRSAAGSPGSPPANWISPKRS